MEKSQANLKVNTHNDRLKDLYDHITNGLLVLDIK